MTINIRVPDIGDFKNVPVIELFVKVGDTVKVDDPIVALESDKATMDVPSSAAGVVTEIKLKIGDRVSEGSVILVLAGAAASTGAPAPAVASATAPIAASAAKTASGKVDLHAEVLVLGSASVRHGHGHVG